MCCVVLAHLNILQSNGSSELNIQKNRKFLNVNFNYKFGPYLSAVYSFNNMKPMM